MSTLSSPPILKMSPTKRVVLSVYKSLLREAEKFAAYNFRMYALRRTRDAFRDNKSITDSDKINVLYDEALNNLKTMQRQTLIHNIYQTNKLVIETKQKPKRESSSIR